MEDNPKYIVQLDGYERDNLAQLLRLVGHVQHQVRELAPCNTGDWVLQIYWKLNPDDQRGEGQPNVRDEDLKQKLDKSKVWLLIKDCMDYDEQAETLSVHGSEYAAWAALEKLSPGAKEKQERWLEYEKKCEPIYQKHGYSSVKTVKELEKL